MDTMHFMHSTHITLPGRHSNEGVMTIRPKHFQGHGEQSAMRQARGNRTCFTNLYIPGTGKFEW